ncbi:bacterio-opsin activator [Natrarchaeobius halalkaliphilus]|uniref:Bacterio-opsin activator n=1 Tax=Natrarchaeobius halalkaliphilus TaxID=1679091 RepID=A0A3N6P9W8_9EURY|nr:helix-turn-helix domain-containing protein [Natrarchaeobius halalkaliphilus]RQG93095.1 bacterio-opsin activator [Natrarchaeobius halalkaliphilus]
MLIATFELEHDAVALTQAFTDEPEMKVEAERIAAHSTKWTMPCLWVASNNFDTADEALSNDPSIRRIVETTSFEEEKYYHLEWADDVEERVNKYIDQQGSILHAEATAHGWQLRIRFVSRDQFDRFRKRLTEQDHSFELLDLTEPGSPRVSFGELTPAQHNALVAAQEHGYYEVPREISARELAEKLDISHQSLSELLRRGTGKIIESTLSTQDVPADI